MYPHSVTAVLSSRSRNVIRRNTTILPLYSLMLGLLALLGFMAIADGVGKGSRPTAQLAIPQLFENMFPTGSRAWPSPRSASARWCPAAIMSIAAANLFTRNIYKDFIKPDATPAQETKVSKLVSLLVKVGALVFVLTMDKTVAINFQLLGGIWILQTFPALVGGLFTRWFHRWALLAGWAVGMVYGTWQAYEQSPAPTQKHFGGSSDKIPGIGEIGYIGLTAFVLNVVVAVVLTFVLQALKAPEGVDETSPADYTAEREEPVATGSGGRGRRSPACPRACPDPPGRAGLTRQPRPRPPVGRPRSAPGAAGAAVRLRACVTVRRRSGRRTSPRGRHRPATATAVRPRAGDLRRLPGRPPDAAAFRSRHSPSQLPRAPLRDPAQHVGLRPERRPQHVCSMLAVAAGESGANPELSRNGVACVSRLARARTVRATCRQRAPADRPGCRRRPGLADWAGGRGAALP